ncbi:hypothetical protein [uncultured Veillonella sp.]|jgi:hypothetical protein|uniref:hypothetical protein n=1 Tax=uncultured Veillonella sp. TaxID=159268 RepID=UPI00258FE75A|nr:hypothetical protein [uncultured Veillonella sp.]
MELLNYLVGIILSGSIAIVRPQRTAQKRINFLRSRYGDDALASDWENVGKDLKGAMCKYEVEGYVSK